MQSHKEILKQEFHIDANTKHHNYPYLHKAILKAMNLAAEQAFKAGTGHGQEFANGWPHDYINAEDYLKKINDEKS